MSGNVASSTVRVGNDHTVSNSTFYHSNYGYGPQYDLPFPTFPSTATLVRKIAAMLLLIGSHWCIFRGAIVGLVFATAATPMCRYALHRT